MQLYLHYTYLNYTYLQLISIFAYVTLAERYSDICMGVQRSCPDLLLVWWVAKFATHLATLWKSTQLQGVLSNRVNEMMPPYFSFLDHSHCLK